MEGGRKTRRRHKSPTGAGTRLLVGRCSRSRSDAEDVAILWRQKIDGETLLEQTEENLRQDGIPRGPATKLFKAILARKPGA